MKLKKKKERKKARMQGTKLHAILRFPAGSFAVRDHLRRCIPSFLITYLADSPTDLLGFHAFLVSF